MNRIVTLAAAAALVCVGGMSRAQDYPNAPIHLISGFPAGSTADISARVIGAKMGQILGQQIIVENEPKNARQSREADFFGEEAVAKSFDRQ